MPASTLAAYSSTPAVTLGESTPDGLGEFLLGVLVEEDVDGMARCEIRLHAWGVKDDSPGYLWFDRDTIDFGTELTVSMGPADESSSVFTGRVSAIECSYAAAGSTIVVLAEDRLQDLRMTRRTRSYADVTDGDVIERIARDHGLTADVQTRRTDASPAVPAQPERPRVRATPGPPARRRRLARRLDAPRGASRGVRSRGPQARPRAPGPPRTRRSRPPVHRAARVRLGRRRPRSRSRSRPALQPGPPSSVRPSSGRADCSRTRSATGSPPPCSRRRRAPPRRGPSPPASTSIGPDAS